MQLQRSVLCGCVSWDALMTCKGSVTRCPRPKSEPPDGADQLPLTSVSMKETSLTLSDKGLHGTESCQHLSSTCRHNVHLLNRPYWQQGCGWQSGLHHPLTELNPPAQLPLPVLLMGGGGATQSAQHDNVAAPRPSNGGQGFAYGRSDVHRAPPESSGDPLEQQPGSSKSSPRHGDVCVGGGGLNQKKTCSGALFSWACLLSNKPPPFKARGWKT